MLQLGNPIIKFRLSGLLLVLLFVLFGGANSFAGSLQLPPVEGLSDAQRSAYDSGFKEFKHFFSPREGLGPVYASNACIACHASGGRGPILLEKMALVKPLTKEPIGDTDKYFPWGQSIRPFFAYPANRGTTKQSGILNPPSDAEVMISQRMPPMIFGRGQMEAVADSEIMRMEAEQATRKDGIHGRINWINLSSGFASNGPKSRVIGRFGLKGRLPTLESFTADAYVGDMGITSDFRPEGIPNPDGVNDPVAPELPHGKVEDVASFMRLMKSPDRLLATGNGAKLFSQIQCAVCHAPSLATDVNHPLAKLGLKRAEIYSDLLLHRLGVSFADGVVDEMAQSQEWRTAPLVNLQASKSFLHDGRATTVESAILQHGTDGSEAYDSVESFKRLSAQDKQELILFVESL